MDIGLTDVWCCFPQVLFPPRESSHLLLHAHKVFSRLDHYFTFRNDIARVGKCEILPITITDHAPVIMDLSMNKDKGETQENE